jgi:hypothetical protein
MLSKNPRNVRIDNPVHTLSQQAHIQRIQRIVRAASRTETIRKASKVFLINRVEDGDHRLLNDFVFQRRDAQRTLPPVGFRYIHSS